MTQAPMTPLGLAAPVGALGAGVAGTDLEPPARLRRIRYYFGLFRRSCHARLAIANWVSGLFPYFVSGAVRGRMYRWAGLSIDPTAFLMGNLELTSGFPDFYAKLA